MSDATAGHVTGRYPAASIDGPRSATSEPAEHPWHRRSLAAGRRVVEARTAPSSNRQLTCM
ncbi:hypothetical protein [Rhodococcus sp. KRD162]|uniref:hypothetical protein n=1 Tax=Rhodococcus sp. KRD162 TaxID=2729725 RepID=UPI0019CF9E0F|nr:hypothetical protein [Rhodococcus sp. KRD162]